MKTDKNQNRIHFTDLQEQENQMHNYWMSISPEERIKNLVQLIRLSFNLKSPNKSNRIYFDSI